MAGALAGRVALVAGATRGAGRGIAIGLGEAGATVYATGRSTRRQRSEFDRPETNALFVEHQPTEHCRRHSQGPRMSR